MYNKINHLKTTALFLCVMACILFNQSFAFSITLLDENFDDVTGLPRANLVLPLNNILLNNPVQLPSGTTWFASSAGNINVRRGDDLINIRNSTYGFDSFFTPTSDNKFLVIGDKTGNIGDMPTSGLMGVSFPFSLRATTAFVTVSYTYVFDGFDTVFPDDIFIVYITDGINKILLDSHSSPDNRSVESPGNISSGIFTATFLRNELPTFYDLRLVFELLENDSYNTNTAVGIDDINITNQNQVPEPSTLLLLGSGLFSLGYFGRKLMK